MGNFNRHEITFFSLSTITPPPPPLVLSGRGTPPGSHWQKPRVSMDISIHSMNLIVYNVFSLAGDCAFRLWFSCQFLSTKNNLLWNTNMNPLYKHICMCPKRLVYTLSINRLYYLPVNMVKAPSCRHASRCNTDPLFEQRERTQVVEKHSIHFSNRYKVFQPWDINIINLSLE